MERRIGKVYGWENAKLVIDYLESLGVLYDAHCHNGVWTLAYEMLPWQHEGLPSPYVAKNPHAMIEDEE